MTFAYADPPYLGVAERHYGEHHEHASDYDQLGTHAELIKQLHTRYPDGWALSMASTNLQALLPLCPPDVRVMAWVKPFASFKPNVPVAYAWEPVIVRGGRKRARTEPTVRDWVAANITLRKGMPGAKPPEFCAWLFDVLGATPTDSFVDLFPGSGAVGDAWDAFRGRARNVALFPSEEAAP